LRRIIYEADPAEPIASVRNALGHRGSEHGVCKIQVTVLGAFRGNLRFCCAIGIMELAASAFAVSRAPRRGRSAWHGALARATENVLIDEFARKV